MVHIPEDLDYSLETKKQQPERDIPGIGALTRSTLEKNHTSTGAATERTRKPATEILSKTVTVPQTIEKLSTRDILKQAERYSTEESSVRELYETNKIDRSGLIKMIKAGIKGYNLQKTYEDVALGRERQRERANEFRHDDPGFTAQQSASSVSTTVNNSQTKTDGSDSSLIIPNMPDARAVQPITTTDTSPPPPVQPVAGPSRPAHYLRPVIIMAVGVGILLVWIIFIL